MIAYYKIFSKNLFSDRVYIVYLTKYFNFTKKTNYGKHFKTQT